MRTRDGWITLVGFTLAITFWWMLVVLGCWTIAHYLAKQAFGADGRPHRRHQLMIAIDDSAASKLLRAEVERNWLQPSPEALPHLKPKDWALLKELDGLSHEIHEYQLSWHVYPHTPVGLKLPAISFTHGWETIDPRAFRQETLPLRSLGWYAKAADSDVWVEELRKADNRRRIEDKRFNYGVLVRLEQRIRQLRPDIVSCSLWRANVARCVYDDLNMRWVELVRNPKGCDWAVMQKVTDAYKKQNGLDGCVGEYTISGDILHANLQVETLDATGDISSNTTWTSLESLGIPAAAGALREERLPFVAKIPPPPFVESGDDGEWISRRRLMPKPVKHKPRAVEVAPPPPPE